MLLLIKLFLVPLLIAAVTIAARRWGTAVAGLLMALPIVAGPALAFYAIEQGNLFGANAARATLLGLIAAALFCLVYGHIARHAPWPMTLAASWLAFGIASTGLYDIDLPLPAQLAAAIAAILVVRALLPRDRPSGVAGQRPVWDLPVRMLTAALLVTVLTLIAGRVGPRISGMLTPFPIAVAIIAAFTHAQQGAAAVTQFLRGFMPGLCTFAIFCGVLAVALPRTSIAKSFALALGVQMLVQLWVLWAMREPAETEVTGSHGGTKDRRRTETPV